MIGRFAALHESASGTNRARKSAAIDVGSLRVKRTQRRHPGQPVFDPLRKSGGPKCCDAQHGVSKDMVGCHPRLEAST
jgi:hypothetical protein